MNVGRAPAWIAQLGVIVVALAAIAAATALGMTGTLSSEAVVAIISGSFGVVGGGAIATAGASSATSGRSVVDDDHLRVLTDAAARRRATDAAAGARSSDDLAARMDRVERVLTAAALQRDPLLDRDEPPPAGAVR